MESFPFKEVHIDTSGRFKYIQIKIVDKEDQDKSWILIRGWRSCGYHADVYDKFINEEYSKISKDSKYQVKGSPGGGRIEHYPDKKSISIYGYSCSFGQPDHSIT